MHRKSITFVILIACFTTTSMDAQSGKSNWARWGGPDSNMISKESDWDTDWKNNPPEKLWSTQIGTGFSSVSIVDGKLYTMGREGRDNDAVYCLNADTGKEIWRHTYKASLSNNMHEGGPGTTPTVADGKVFTLSRGGRALGLDAATGKVIWDVETRELTGARRPTWGFTSSALVVGEKVIFDVGRILALDAKTGKEIWKSSKQYAGYGSVVPFKHEDKLMLAALTNEALHVVDPSNGKTIAKTKWKTQFNTSSTSPMIHGDQFFISTGYRRGCAMYRFKGGEFEKLFENNSLANHMNNSVRFQGHIYGVHGNSHNRRNCTLVCLDAKTGKRQWSERGMGCGSLLIAGDHLIVLADKGELICAKVSPNGFKPTGKVQAVKGKCWTVPVLLNRKIYCRTARGELACWQLKSSKQ